MGYEKLRVAKPLKQLIKVLELHTRHIARENREQWREARMLLFGCLGSLIRASEEWDNEQKGVYLKRFLDDFAVFRGMMLGRVSSQYVANFYLNDTDKFIMSLGIEVLRYVDDFLLISDDKRRILEHVSDIEQFLYRDTGLTLHFHKRYFQRSDKGVSVVGYTFKGDRIYISKRCVGRAITRVRSFGRRVQEVDMFVSSVNSYLGRTMDCRAYNQRLKIINSIHPVWWKELYAREHLRKIVKRGKISNFEKIKI